MYNVGIILYLIKYLHDVNFLDGLIVLLDVNAPLNYDLFKLFKKI